MSSFQHQFLNIGPYAKHNSNNSARSRFLISLLIIFMPKRTATVICAFEEVYNSRRKLISM
jgi:hypothetical protein